MLNCSHVAGFVFLPILQKELHEFKRRWNRHRIRKNRFSSCPSGAPEDLYNLSAYQGKHVTIYVFIYIIYINVCIT